MELDKRITKIAIIYDCFDCKDARTSIGEKGYFSHYYHCFSDLNECRFGVLQDVIDGEHPYDNGKNQYDFFLPDRYVINSGKQYRPYTFMEFTDKFTVGQPIKFRQKGAVGFERYLILNGYQHEQREGRTVTYIYIGSYGYTLDALFNDYEWQEHYTEDFKPFGVGVKE